MNQYKLRKISFGSYVKLIALATFGTGLLFGLFSFILTLCGAPVSVNGKIVDYGTGIFVGLLMLIIFPLAWGGVLTVFSLITYPILSLLLKLFKGIKIKAVIEIGKDVRNIFSDEDPIIKVEQ